MRIGRDQGRENGEKQEEQELVSRFKKAKEKEINAEARQGKESPGNETSVSSCPQADPHTAAALSVNVFGFYGTCLGTCLSTFHVLFNSHNKFIIIPHFINEETRELKQLPYRDTPSR